MDAESSRRDAPLAMSPDTFRALGHQVIDDVADFLASLPARPVATAMTPAEVVAVLAADTGLPAVGIPAETLVAETLPLLLSAQVINGHPRFWAYITAGPAPIGILGEVFAAALNPNVGLWHMSPMASAIEEQTARWIAELIGYADPGEHIGGVMSSGGQMANVIGILAGRRVKAPWDVRTAGVRPPGAPRLRLYASTQCHAWLAAAANMLGFGTDAVHWIPVTDQLTIDLAALRAAIADDRARGDLPLLVVGTAGTVSTGAIDPLPELAAVCREEDLWFHIDAAYGGFAAVLPDPPVALRGIRAADSVAVDPHKWLYAPLDVGCTLVRDPEHLRATFSARPDYYRTEEGSVIDQYEIGPENSRRFRALKVWLALRQVGRAGYQRMIADDIALSEELFALVQQHPRLEAHTRGLSITTFRYVPEDLQADAGQHRDYLNALNREILHRLQAQGQAFLSQAIVAGAFVLRVCIVNFRTTRADIAMLPGLVAELGAATDRALRPEDAGAVQ